MSPSRLFMSLSALLNPRGFRFPSLRDLVQSRLSCVNLQAHYDASDRTVQNRVSDGACVP